MIVTQKKEMNRVYTLFSEGEIDETSYAVQMALHHLLDGLLCTYLHTLDGEQIWSCEHTGKQSLSDYCENHELGREELKWIWHGILETILETEEFLLDVDCLYLDEKEIYLEQEDQEIRLCYVPFEKEPIWKRMQELAQYLLGYLDQTDAQAVQMAYGIFRYLANGGSSVDEMWLLLLELEQKKPDEVSSDTMVQMVRPEFLEEVAQLISMKDKHVGEHDKKEPKPFPVGRWILTALPIAMAVFLCAFVAFHEWYLSNQRKILLLVIAAVLGGAGILFWKKWRFAFKKEDFFDETDAQEQEDIKPELAKLVRKDTKEEIPIYQIPSVVGKIPEAVQILIPEPAVSRIHAKISVIQGEYYVEDLSSKNGTYVNGRRLDAQKPARLEGNDELAFANICCYFQLSNQ